MVIVSFTSAPLPARAGPADEWCHEWATLSTPENIETTPTGYPSRGRFGHIPVRADFQLDGRWVAGMLVRAAAGEKPRSAANETTS
jgi:hypothetical protein